MSATARRRGVRLAARSVLLQGVLTDRGEAADNRMVVGEAAVAVQLDKLSGDAL